MTRQAEPRPSRSDRVAAIRRLQAAGLPQVRIAEQFGLSRSYVSMCINDPDGSRVREKREAARGTCEVCGCATSKRSNRRCPHHAQRKRMTDAERLAKFSQTTDDGCIVWTGFITTDGYGRCRFWAGGQWKSRNAHVVSYIVHKGPVPAGMHVHHVCYNRRCINPAHLELRTPRDNTLDAGSRNVTRKNAEKTHCVHGHPYDAENTYVRPTGERLCRECSRRNSRETARRKKERARLNQSLATSGAKP